MNARSHGSTGNTSNSGGFLSEQPERRTLESVLARLVPTAGIVGVGTARRRPAYGRRPAGTRWFCMVIDEHELIRAVRALNAAGRPARADTVSIELGAIADDGGSWDVMIVADDLAELESLGKLERAAAFEWEGIGRPPKALIAYEEPREQ